MKYIFVIPTLNRADVLPWSIDSILNQNGKHDINIIISNNKSDDNTKEVVCSYKDSRIKYIEPPRRLSMSKHWEFAAQYIDCENSVICYLGDDDIVASNALNIISELFSKHNEAQSIKSTPNYYWTTDCDHLNAGWLSQPPIDGTYKIIQTDVIIKKIAANKEHYTAAPSLYRGFVKSDLFQKVKLRGPLFNIASPDIYSNIGLACTASQYISLEYPLTLGVASPKSNGLQASIKDTVIGNEFFRSSKEDFDHKYPITAVPFQVLEALEKQRKAFCLDLRIDYVAYMKAVLQNSKFDYISQHSEIISSTANMSILAIYATAGYCKLVKIIKNLIKVTMYDVMRLKRGYHLSVNRHGKQFYFFGNLNKEKGIESPQQALDFIIENTNEVTF